MTAESFPAHSYLLRFMVRLPRLSRPVGILTSRLFRLLNLRWTLRSGVGFQLQAYSDWYAFNDVFVDGEYDEPIERVVRARSSEDRLFVVDLGANSGFFILRLIDRARRQQFRGTIHILAGEGAVRNVARLRANLRVASLGENVVVTVVHGLVGARTGRGHMRELPFDVMNHVATAGSVVPYVDLSPMLQAWPRIDLLKCDIEGSEIDFIRTYPDLLQKTDMAVFELHQVQRTELMAEARTLLETCGLSHRTTLRRFEQNTVELFWR